MAFAAKGQPKPGDTQHKSSGKALEDNRLPAIIALSNPRRERIVRKPPIPRGLSKVGARPAKHVAVATNVTINTASRRKPEPVTKVRVKSPSSGRSQPTTSRATSKPGLPPRLKANQTQVAPDSLVISAQLAPWLYMRSSLEGMLEQLEIETEGILKAENEKLLEAEKLVEESQRRVDLDAQRELLHDLCDEKNSDFSSSLSILTKDLFSFIAQSGNPSSISSTSTALEALKDKVHSTDWEDETLEKLRSELDTSVRHGQAIECRLNETLKLLRDPDHVLQSTLKYPARWKTVLERFGSLLQKRIQNLHVLQGAASSVARYQKRRIELEVMNLALS